MYFTGNLTRGSGQAFNDNFAISSHSFFLLFRCATIFFITTAPYGFGTSLQNPEFAITFVNAPFHIHVAAIVFFNLLSIASQFDDLFIGQLLHILFIQRNHNFFAVAASFANQLDILTIYVFLNNFVSFFANGVVVRSYGALNNIFAQAPSSFHQNVLVVASCNVNSEHNACSFGEYHHLDCCAQCNVQMIEALFFTIVNSAVGKAGSIAFFNFSNDGFSALYVQIGILLTSEACVRQIFCGSRAANCNIGLVDIHFLAQFFVSCSDCILQILGHFFFKDSLTDTSAHVAKQSTVFNVSQLANQFTYFIVQTTFFKEVSVSVSSSSEAIRNGNVNLSGHFAQRGGLATNNSNVFSFQLFKPKKELFFFFHDETLLYNILFLNCIINIVYTISHLYFTFKRLSEKLSQHILKAKASHLMLLLLQEKAFSCYQKAPIKTYLYAFFLAGNVLK